MTFHLKRELGMEKRQPVHEFRQNTSLVKNFHYSTHIDLELRHFNGKLRKAQAPIEKSVLNVLVSYLKYSYV